MLKTEIALYGSVGIKRSHCPDCESSAFVLDGRLQCCDRRTSTAAKTYRRETSPRAKRVKPSQAVRTRILEDQGNKCLYCDKEFGLKVLKGAKIVQLRVNWDHLVPYAFSQNNTEENFVAACQLCNGIKSSRCFDTLDEAKSYILNKRKQKGYDDPSL